MSPRMTPNDICDVPMSCSGAPSRGVLVKSLTFGWIPIKCSTAISNDSGDPLAFYMAPNKFKLFTFHKQLYLNKYWMSCCGIGDIHDVYLYNLVSPLRKKCNNFQL